MAESTALHSSETPHPTPLILAGASAPNADNPSSSVLADSKRVNFLLLDGGGVRGLSSLLILQRLMELINLAVKQDKNYSGGDVLPHQVFDCVAGTSTGGLIALMLGKMSMTVAECIEAYHDLSWQIFSKKRRRGRLSGGLARSRYSGKTLRECFRRLLHTMHFDMDLSLVRTPGHGKDTMQCAVVCREHESSSKYSDTKPDVVCICSLPCCSCNIACEHTIQSLVCDAARATSAAFTYFPVMEIQRRYFSDGGMEYNNPSFAIWDHYTLDERRGANQALSGRRSSYHADTSGPASTTHPGVPFTNVRMVNIGTGSKIKGTPERQRDKYAEWLPGWLRMGLFLKRTLTEVATQSERTAHIMRNFQKLAPKQISYHRLSASNGVCWIKLDAYRELTNIETLTNQWMDDYEHVKSDMTRLAREIADDFLREYVKKHGAGL